ncbi:MAG: homogentisate 1,2-dioxygenase [Bdellovibrionales bacterium]
MSLVYQSGFRNYFESETETGLLPQGQNSPQKLKNGLYAELLSGSAFTQPRIDNLRTWLYRKRPSVSHGRFQPKAGLEKFISSPDAGPTMPDQYRWLPEELPTDSVSFLKSIKTMVCSGALGSSGSNIHHYNCNQGMSNQYFMNADGEFLLVPQLGGLRVSTEMGILQVSPTEILVIPRGIKFSVELINKSARGYLLENFGAPLQLPDLGPIGSSGLAAPRDFQAPTAYAESSEKRAELVYKFQGNFFSSDLSSSPLDVEAWHGNYYPYKYDLKKFNTINSVSFDHPDPSIFTVLSSPSNTPGKANLDFVIFPPRWMVAENTFRPPYYHRNIMSEYMGLIHGVYDAKETGFLPGGASLHNSMTAHGPDSDVFKKASEAKLEPVYQADTLAFMFEGPHIFQPTKWALSKNLDTGYVDCWKDL